MRTLSDVNDCNKDMTGLLDLCFTNCKTISENSLGDFIEDLYDFSREKYQLVVEEFIEGI